MKTLDGPYEVRLPGSEDDVVFWQAIVVQLMHRLNTRTVGIILSDLRGSLNLTLSAIPEMSVIVLDLPQARPEPSLADLPSAGSQPS